jgi:preprotein translocase subunit SecG
MLSFFLYLCVTLLLLVSVFLVLLVLIQKGRGGGLASAFGGSGGNTAFGSKTGDVLTWATSILFGVFLLLAVLTVRVADAVHKKYVAGSAGAVQTTPPAPGSPLNSGMPAPSGTETPADVPAPAPAPSSQPAP